MTDATTRPRNFSPWFQVVTRLMATREVDPLPADPAGVEAWSDRFRARLADRVRESKCRTNRGGGEKSLHRQ